MILAGGSFSTSVLYASLITLHSFLSWGQEIRPVSNVCFARMLLRPAVIKMMKAKGPLCYKMFV